MLKILSNNTKKQALYYFKIIMLILVIWILQMLFLNQAARTGFDAWDDWGMLFTYDAFKANDLRNFPIIAKFYGSPYLWSESYNIGLLKDIFGLNQTIIRYVEILFKSLAAFSISALVFKLIRNKLFSFLTIFFFIIFPSTAGPLNHIIFTGAYLTIIFICFSIFFYTQSIINPKKILLSSFFFFLALLVCPSRAYLIAPIPFLIELTRLIRSFKFLIFLRNCLVFYFPLIAFQILLFLNGDRPHPAFLPHSDIISRFQQVTSGNLYTLSLPFQAISSLFIDPSFVQKLSGDTKLLLGFTKINIILLILSLGLGLATKGKRFISFTLRLMGLTILIEAIFYLFGNFSLNNNQILYKSIIDKIQPYSQTLNPSIFQATLGGFYSILGLLLSWEWWKYHRNNRLLLVILFAWLWSIFSVVLLYLTSHWYGMLTHSIDRYIIVSSPGAVIFIAGIFTVCIQSATKIKNFNLKLLSFALVIFFITLTIWGNYQLLDKAFFHQNEILGSSAFWQDTMYQKFIHKSGRDNLKNPTLLYIDPNKNLAFINGSFSGPARFRLFYDESGKLIRGTCKAIVTDLEILKNGLEIQNGEKGFSVESICLNPTVSYQVAFYPFNNFYAYRIEGKEFIDIKENILNQINSSTKPITISGNDKVENKITFISKGINPDSFYYPFKRIWERFYLLTLFQLQSKINYEKNLYDKRFTELNYVVKNRILSQVEGSTKRFAYQTGVLVSDLIKQNNSREKDNLVKKFQDDIVLLAELRDHFHSNSSYWLLIQNDIDTLKIVSNQLKFKISHTKWNI